MFGKKTLFAAAAVAVLSVAGLGSASAAPWEHRAERIERRMDRIDNRLDRRIDRIERRHYADRFVIERSLRPYHYRMVGAPYFTRGHYVARTYDRFGRVVMVRIDPYSGAYLGVFRL
jgi:hypothetical protein